MKNNKFFLASIVGAVTFFLLGWIVWGMLLKNFMAANSGLPADVMAQVNLPEDQFNWLAMVVSNLAMGLLLATILMWGGFTSTAAGMRAGAIVGLLIAIMWDFLFLGMTRLMTMQFALVDILASAVVWAIGGAVVGMILAKGTSTASA
jgi:hypothetical protein